MIDATTDDTIRVSTDGDSGPYIMVPEQQVEAVRRLLAANDILHWVDEHAISIDGEHPITVFNLARDSDPAEVQRMLDDAT